MENGKKRLLIVDDSPSWIRFHLENIRAFFPDKFIIDTAMSAKIGYEKVLEMLESPYDVIISDLQMELDFEPKHAGEWFVENVKTLKEYKNTSIIIISASYDIKTIAESLGVEFLRKSTAINSLGDYKSAIAKL